MIHPQFLLALVIVVIAARGVRGDVFFLSTGGEIRGKLLNPDESPRKAYDVETTDGIKMTLRKDQVDKVVRANDPAALYDKYLPQMQPTAEDNWKMAEWCLKTGLTEKRKLHLAAVLRLDPSHEKAHRAVGHELIDGKWQKRSEYWAGRGYQRYKGDWRLPQEVALATAKDQREKEEIEWRVKIKRWRSWILKNRGKQAEALQELRAIDDQAASRPLVELLRDKKEPPQLKLLYIAILTKLESPLATDVFLDLVVESNNSQVREACVNSLVSFESAFAVDVLSRRLKDKENVHINRAAYALGRLGDTRATVPLIEALTTKHKRVLPGSGSNIGASFDKNGGGGLSTGGGPKVIEQLKANRSVLNALTTLHPGVSFEFNEARWQAWYEDVQTPKALDLRRAE